MSRPHSIKRSWSIIWVALLALILVPTTALAWPLNDDDSGYEYTGIVQSRPAGTMIGAWVIGGRSFSADAWTHFEQEHGLLQVGTCAKVEYQIVSGTYRAIKIESQESYHCGGGGDDDGDTEYKGIVHSMPGTGLVGTWQIGTMTFQTDTTTRFKEGTPYVGACVKVKYNVINSQNVVHEMELDDECSAGDGDSRQEVHGSIESFPAGLIGDWRIHGVTYTATATTYFEQSDGPFNVGACVEVTYMVQNGANVALSIKTEDEYCGGPGGSSIQKIKGVLEAFPPAPHYGTWAVSGNTYTVTQQTVLDTRHGAFQEGVCVEVKYDPATRTAYQMETDSPDDCGNAGSAPGQTVIKTAGTITGMPTNGLFGTWTIGGTSYEAITGTTTFEQEHGAFALNRCAEVKYYVDGATNVATKISTEHEYTCSGSGQESEAYGTVEILPPTSALTGTWTIGGINYLVDANTRLEDGPFTLGLLVEIKFVREADGTLRATKIEGKGEINDEDQDRAKAYGRIDQLPTTQDLTGTWMIAGIDYTVTANTRLKRDAGSFQVNACVEVYYQASASGNRTAKKIETQPDAKCPNDADSGETLNRSYGFVEQRPPTGFVGTWRIGGVQYEADAQTTFEESHGALVVGAYVEAAYVAENGVNVARKIETHVPPEAGDITAMGTLQRGTHRLVVGETWTVGGQTYTVIDATVIDDSQADLTDGQPARINAYTDPTTGQRVATHMTTLDTIYSVYLPLMRR